MERKKKLVVCFILGRSGGGMGWQFGTWESIYISISTHLLLRFFLCLMVRIWSCTLIKFSSMIYYVTLLYHKQINSTTFTIKVSESSGSNLVESQCTLFKFSLRV